MAPVLGRAQIGGRAEPWMPRYDLVIGAGSNLVPDVIFTGNPAPAGAFLRTPVRTRPARRWGTGRHRASPARWTAG
jgi:hypothetical protein